MSERGLPVLDVATAAEPSSSLRSVCGDEDVLVLGVGNVLMGDEGVGVHAIRMLEASAVPRRVRLLDGGTGGAGLLSFFESLTGVIVIDATRDGSPAGTVGYLYRRLGNVADLPRGLGAHDFGVKELFSAAALLHSLPCVHLFTIAVEEIVPMSVELSPPVRLAMRQVVEGVLRLSANL